MSPSPSKFIQVLYDIGFREVLIHTPYHSFEVWKYTFNSVGCKSILRFIFTATVIIDTVSSLEEFIDGRFISYNMLSIRKILLEDGRQMTLYLVVYLRYNRRTWCMVISGTKIKERLLYEEIPSTCVLSYDTDFIIILLISFLYFMLVRWSYGFWDMSNPNSFAFFWIFDRMVSCPNQHLNIPHLILQYHLILSRELWMCELNEAFFKQLVDLLILNVRGYKRIFPSIVYRRDI